MSRTLYFVAASRNQEALVFSQSEIDVNPELSIAKLQEALVNKYYPDSSASTAVIYQVSLHVFWFWVVLLKPFQQKHPVELDPDVAETLFPTFPALLENAKAIRLRKYVKDLADEDFVAIFTPKDPVVPPTKPESDSEALDIISELKNGVCCRYSILTPKAEIFSIDFTKYVRNVVDGKPPSVLAQSKEYNDNQGAPATAVLDGRYAQDGPSTVAPPIELYHPVFGAFMQRCRTSDIEIPEGILRDTASLLRSVSRIAVKEAPRDAQTRKILADILGVGLERITNSDKTSPDFMSVTPTPLNVNGACIISEIKSELGSGGSDPSRQSALSYARFYCRPEVSLSSSNYKGSKTDVFFPKRAQVREVSCCPTFLIGLAGPWIVIMGAVLTSRTIVQRLSAYEWLGCSRMFDDEQVHRIAHVLYALRLSLVELNEYYARLSSPVVEPGHIPPRFCPSISSFSIRKTKIPFVYAYPLQHNPASVTFKATRTDTKESVVIKFVRQYGHDVHKLMAAHGLAPKLLSFSPLGELYGNLNLVAMEFIEGKTLHDAYDISQPLPDSVKNSVRKGLDLLNKEGFVFGDLRRPNVMLADGDEPAEKRIRFVDFDWAEKDGAMRYPFHISSVVSDPSGASDYDRITHQHQENMFTHL
ncbi:hypothetical protein F5876DRAFT_42169 [Lentinula aff. lateritia]|uniref:Uncharacterized protein n=1 Tax=Lentinula aff. lateritia TaxID=2804960 RepID=A0ACC1TZN5_9AGAR|nr:hypothetical protein F5876DRAFT_42169 [Lentinula aff. lateritia]